MAKIEPAVTQLLYPIPDGTSYIDLAKDLSKVNRRLYRQGYTYVVQDIQCVVPSGLRASDISTFTFSTVGNSWIVHNAWKKAFGAWRAQQRDILKHLPTSQGKWADFKIYLDDEHEDGTTLEPYAGDNAVYITGEWEHSKLVFDDDGTEREFKMHMIGSSNLADTNNESGIGLIQEYQNSRAFPNADPALPSAASDTVYAKMIGYAPDELTDIMVDNMENDNDLPPYDPDEYPGGDTNADAAVPVRLAAVSGTQAVMTSPGFIAPCGLIKVYTSELSLTNTTESATDLGDVGGTGVASPGPLSVYQSGTASQSYVIVTVAPGPYRGVLAAPMGQ